MIQFIENEQIFKIDTENSTYVIGIFKEGYLLNLYYGRRLDDEGIGNLWALMNRHPSASFSPSDPILGEHGYNSFSVDAAPMEYPTNGKGDFRISAIEIKNDDGNSVTDLRYSSFKIYSGRPDISPLPSIRCDNNDGETLELTLVDRYTEVEVKLYYTVVKGLDALVKSVKIINNGQQSLKLERAFSGCYDLPTDDFDLITLYGRHAFERNFNRNPLFHGIQSINSARGSSSHSHNPFAALVSKNADERNGEVYGFNFVYSGNFDFSVEVNHDCTSRVLMGINPTNFEWNLANGDSFQTPETVSVYSDEGIGKMSRIFHDLYNYHVVNPVWQVGSSAPRPLLINSWEAAYFDFDTEKILSFARKAKPLGIDMLVMDDGWFGKRDNDRSSLGDWFVNEEKLPGGVKRLSDELHKMGMKFGIWFEPEMISPDSDLFRAHSDWFVHVPGREASTGRTQYVLDVSREDVRDNVLGQIFEVFDSCEIDYIKWDYNRNISEPGSELLDEEHSEEFFHRFILGTYDMMDRFTKRYPNVLFENCSGGGGRYDPAMLYYSPQIWASDNTDPIDRLMIQFGTSMCYPASTMGAHVSSCKRTDIDTRANVALWGTFGYELDPNKLTDEECEKVKCQVEEYHKYYELTHAGDLYRLINPWDNPNFCAWELVKKDKSECLATFVVMKNAPRHVVRLKLEGLDENAKYADDDGNVYQAKQLMYAGIDLSWHAERTNESVKFHFTKVK